MNAALLSLYHRAPAPLKDVAASARGYWLRRFRYGPESDRLAAEALERESWPRERWRYWQNERLAELLERAAESVPYYRQHWAERRRHGDDSPVDRLESWPILTKQQVREDPTRFVVEESRGEALAAERTSGTTGSPLTVYWSKATARAWYALFEARARLWNGVSRRDSWAHIGGQLVTPRERTSPPYWVKNRALRQLYCSSYHLAPGRGAAYVQAIRAHGTTHVLGYPSSLESLALLAEEEGVPPLSLRLALGNAEPLSPRQRRRIGRLFGCAVRDTYGMAELVAAASECAAGAMHLWPEVGRVEILDEEGEPLAGGEAGRVVATGLLNQDMLLIRYDTGDRGTLDANWERCACGRGLPRLSAIEGRADDVVLAPDGTRIGRLDPVFKDDLPVREAQIVQESLDTLRVRVVPLPAFHEGHAEALREAVRARVGSGVTVLVESVPHLPRTAAGKLRAVVSCLPEPTREIQ